METLSEIAHALRARAPEFRDAVHSHLYARVLPARAVFPLSLAHTHLELAAACAWVLERTPTTAVPPQELLETLRQLGREHRRHGFPPEIYQEFADSIAHGLHTLQLPQAELAARALRAACQTMADAARADDLAGVAPAFSAEVLEVQRRTRNISVVRLEAGGGLNYAPGQYLPVTTSYFPGVWRMLTPALPANSFGQLEFHVELLRGNDVSTLLATPKPGDYWTFGSPAGNLHMSGDNDVLMIAHGTGLAAARALLFDALTWDTPPRVHLYVAADYPGELYDLMGLWNLAMVNEWLSIVPVVTHEKDAWWVGAGTGVFVPSGLHIHHAPSGGVGAFVASFGAWADREVIITGPTAKVENTAAQLIAAGTPPGNIQTLTWSQESRWPTVAQEKERDVLAGDSGLEGQEQEQEPEPEPEQK